MSITLLLLLLFLFCDYIQANDVGIGPTDFVFYSSLYLSRVHSKWFLFVFVMNRFIFFWFLFLCRLMPFLVGWSIRSHMNNEMQAPSFCVSNSIGTDNRSPSVHALAHISVYSGYIKIKLKTKKMHRILAICYVLCVFVIEKIQVMPWLRWLNVECEFESWAHDILHSFCVYSIYEWNLWRKCRRFSFVLFLFIFRHEMQRIFKSFAILDACSCRQQHQTIRKSLLRQT